MSNKDYDALTDAQNARDSEFLEQARESLVVPLLDKLNQAIPGYESLSEWERFLALMRLNEQVAPNGESLMLDFGFCEGKGRMRGAVYSGESETPLYSEKEGVKLYAPMFQELRMLTWRDWLASIPGTLYALQDDFLADEKLPLPFKIAVVALHLRENLLIYPIESCRFAAGWDDEVKPQRWMGDMLRAPTGQIFGYTISIRDTLPENDFAVHLARILRTSTTENATVINDETRYATVNSYYAGRIPKFAEYEPGKKQIRSRHESTESLVDFVERYLPNAGYYVGRSGNGQRLTWEQARLMFAERFPSLSDKYNSAKSFADSYYNARKAREGR